MSSYRVNKNKACVPVYIDREKQSTWERDESLDLLFYQYVLDSPPRYRTAHLPTFQTPRHCAPTPAVSYIPHYPVDILVCVERVGGFVQGCHMADIV